MPQFHAFQPAVDKGMNREKILILAPSWDFHAAAVAWGLEQNGVESIWAPSLYPSISNVLSVYCHPALGVHYDDACELAAIRSAWTRRVKRPIAPAASYAPDRVFIAREQYAAQKIVFDLSSIANHIFWVNDYGFAQRAESKLLQLEKARQIGLKIPDTLVSCDPATVRRFLKDHPEAIAKNFTPHYWVERESRNQHLTTTARISSETLLEDDSIALCPAIYQELINKRFDVRATVVGSCVFGAKITTRSGCPILDWRQDTLLGRVEITDYPLPEELKVKLHNLMDFLGLNFGCIDLAVDHTGKFVFLEVNPTGQFLFVEDMDPRVKLLQAFCAMLIKGNKVFSFEDSRALSLADFYDSGAFAAWSNAFAGTDESEREWAVSYE